MKSLKLIGGNEYVLEDAEADYLQKLIYKGELKFVQLSNGDLINISSISRLGSLDKKAHWSGHPLNDDKTGFWRGGQFIHLEAENFNMVEYLEDPKYLAMLPIKLLK